RDLAASRPNQDAPQGWSLQSCHLDRLRGSEATEREWRDRENASSANLIRGVLPKLRVAYCAHPPRPKTKLAHLSRRTSPTSLGLHSLVAVGKCASGDSYSGRIP